MIYKKLFIIVPVAIVSVTAALAGVMYGTHVKEINAIFQDVNQKKQLITDTTFKRKGYTILYDKNKKVLSKLISEQYVYEPNKNISNYVKDAFISTEDKTFFKHGAISYKGTFRALIQIMRHKGDLVQGGSTLTQQLVKNAFLTNKKTLDRKVEEILLAKDIEKKYSKEKVLEYYLNNIYFGRGNYGIETASREYFQKSSKQLTLSEAAFLAAIPNNPSKYDPMTNKANTIKRRNLILYNMLQQNYINKIQYNNAVREQIVLNPVSHPAQKEDYTTSYALYNATRDLMAYDGFNFRYSFKDDNDKAKYQNSYSRTYSDYDKKIRAGGYSIYTSIDPDKQESLQQSVDNQLSGFTARDPSTNKYQVQGAAISIDNNSGYVDAVVGGRDNYDEFNRAFLAYRQPGSAIKPVLVYTPSFDLKYHPLSKMSDQYIPNGPINDEHSYFGSVTLRYATEMSLNTIPYLLMERIGADKLMPYLLNMHFSGIYKQDYNAISAIGGFTKGVSPSEMAGAYSTLEHNGEFAESTCIRAMNYQDGSIIVKIQNKLDRKKVYTSESSYMMTDILKGVLTEDYATGHNLSLANGQIAAAKTGTTSDNKDGWFCGYTKYYTTVVWVGSDTPKKINNLYGAVYPGAIWKDYMDKIHMGLKPQNFEKPNTIVYKNIDPNTGEIVSYNSGIQDMFSKPILDKIADDKKKAEAATRANQEANYRDAEPEREKQIEKDLEKYESVAYIDINSLDTIDSLRDTIDFEIKQLIDVDKADLFRDRLDKITVQLKQNRDKWENIKSQNIKNAQLQIQVNNSDIDKLNKEQELIESQKESDIAKKQLQDKSYTDEINKETSAAKAVKKVQSFPNTTDKNNTDFTDSIKDANNQISSIDNSELRAVLKQVLTDKVNSLSSEQGEQK